MRTTIQLQEEQRNRLLEIAAERGQRGCSKIVQEAVSRYLQGLEATPAVTVEPARATAHTLALAPLPEHQRQRLLAIAAARGPEGLSKVLQEAVAQYLDSHDRPPSASTGSLISRAVYLLGTLLDESSACIEVVVRTVRVRLGRAAA